MYVPFGVETIEEYSVQGNTVVKHLVIPDSVKIIKNNAFYNCFNLETIELGKNVERMGQDAFSNTAWFSNSLSVSSIFFSLTGFVAPSGISQVFPVKKAPGIMPWAQ